MSSNNKAATASSTAANTAKAALNNIAKNPANTSYNNAQLPSTPDVQSSSSSSSISTPNPESVKSAIQTMIDAGAKKLQITAEEKSYTVIIQENTPKSGNNLFNSSKNLSKGGVRSRRHKKCAYKKTHRRNRR